MFRWLRGVLAGLFGWFDLRARIDDLEYSIEHMQREMSELEIHWTNEVDKLTKLHQRASKRVQDGIAALAESAPAPTDIRIQREARKAELRNRRAGGLHGT